MREPVPPLASIARSDATDSALHSRARVDLSRSRLGIAESEMGRHAAEVLIAVWGPKTTEAWAGGNLLPASQEAKPNRTARARQKLDDIIATTLDVGAVIRFGDELAGLAREEK